MIDTLFFEHHLRSYSFSLFSLLVICMIYSMLKISHKQVSCPMGGLLVQFSMHFQTVQAASLFSNFFGCPTITSLYWYSDSVDRLPEGSEMNHYNEEFFFYQGFLCAQ